MRNIYGVHWQEETFDVDKDGKRSNYRHGAIGTDRVIADSPEAAEKFVRARHTGKTVRPLHVSTVVLLSDVESVLEAPKEAKPAKKEEPKSDKPAADQAPAASD